MSLVPGRAAAFALPSLRCTSVTRPKVATALKPYSGALISNPLLRCRIRSISTPIETPLRICNRPPSLQREIRPLHVRRYSSGPEEQRNPDDDPEYQKAVQDVKKKQKETPWHREGSTEPPVRKERSAGAMTKGKLLTTPARLLKLIIPVTTHDYNEDRKDVEPLALLVHPQQPLSYLERLIQSEVPPVKAEDGQLKPPSISFMAMEVEDDSIQPKHSGSKYAHEKQDAEAGESRDGSPSQKGGPEHESHRYLERLETGEDDKKQHFVRWSSSTEIGDFIRDAARAKEFIVVIEGSPLGQICVGVPSFNDRTYYLRMRLRKVSRQIRDMAVIKNDCDVLAHRGAQRVAVGGFGVLVLWWYLVYRLTFETELGWDTMEPVTYLASLSTLMGGYLWFLYHNREVSYRSALDFTINKRQKRLYQMKGVDLQMWESLVDEANALRKEIKTVAAEYDVDWDERADEQDERVTKALKQVRKQKNGTSGRHSDTPGNDQEED